LGCREKGTKKTDGAPNVLKLAKTLSGGPKVKDILQWVSGRGFRPKASRCGTEAN